VPVETRAARERFVEERSAEAAVAPVTSRDLSEMVDTAFRSFLVVVMR
jgi:hypothetical protein